MQIDLANALWVGNSTHDALVLDTQRKVQLVYILLELANWDEIGGREWIVNFFEGIVERDFSSSEDVGHKVDELLLSRDTLWIHL